MKYEYWGLCGFMWEDSNADQSDAVSTAGV